MNAAAAQSETGAETCIVCAAGAIDGDLLWHGLLGTLFLWFILLVLVAGPSVVYTVPVVARVLKTVADSDRTVPKSAYCSQHMLRKIVDGLLVSVMGDDDPRLDRRVTTGKGTVEKIFGSLNERWAVILPVVRVDIVENSMVSHVTHGIAASRVSKATRVRRAHICREAANDIPQSAFVFLHLLTTLCRADFAEIFVRPGVAGNLVAAEQHAFDERSPRQRGIIDLAFAIVDTRDEESGRSFILVEQIKKLACIPGWAIIEGQSNCSRDSAGADLLRTVQDMADVRAKDFTGGWSLGSSVSIAGAEVDQAVRRAAVQLRCATVTWYPALVSRL